MLVDPLPSDAFYSRTNYGKKLLSATTNSTFYYIPQGAVSNILEKQSNQSNPSQSTLLSQSSQVHSKEEIPTTTATTAATGTQSTLFQETTQQQQQQNQQQQNSNSNSVSIDESILPNRFESVKSVSIRNNGGCNSKQGLNTLQLTLSLSERYFLYSYIYIYSSHFSLFFF